MTGVHFLEPGVKSFSRALTYHVEEFSYQLVGDFQVWTCLPQLAEVLLLFRLEILSLAEKEKGWPVMPRASRAHGAGPVKPASMPFCAWRVQGSMLSMSPDTDRPRVATPCTLWRAVLFPVVLAF